MLYAATNFFQLYIEVMHLLKFIPERGTKVYEQVDGGEGGAAVSDPTYIEVGE